MKIFFIFLFLIFSFQLPTKADDIRDFKIGDMSIGDSLLSYFSESFISNKKKLYYSGSKEFFIISFKSKDESYDVIQTSVTNDDKYIINSIAGKILYKNEFKKCLKKVDSIVDDLKKTLPEDVERQNSELYKMPSDPTGKSVNDGVTFWFPNEDYIAVECTDWSDEMDYQDNLKIRFTTKFYNDWLLNEAHK